MEEREIVPKVYFVPIIWAEIAARVFDFREKREGERKRRRLKKDLKITNKAKNQKDETEEEEI